MPRKLILLIAASLLLLGSLPACASQAEEVHLDMAPMSGMPAQVQSAAVTVQQAYQFNVANPEVMKNIPCYCGCGSMGHTSNYDCYVSGVDEKGTVSFDNHALGCSICVDITQDVMRLMREGKSPGETRVYVDTKYAQFGPSNIE